MDENYTLDIFEMMARTSEPTKELIKKKLLVYKCYQMDVKNIKCFFQWQDKHEICFLLLDFWHVKS
jgi:hypothetical protein